MVLFPFPPDGSSSALSVAFPLILLLTAAANLARAGSARRPAGRLAFALAAHALTARFAPAASVTALLIDAALLAALAYDAVRRPSLLPVPIASLALIAVMAHLLWQSGLLSSRFAYLTLVSCSWYGMVGLLGAGALLQAFRRRHVAQ